MKIQPMARIALASEPTPFFSEGIEVDEKEEEYAEHAELDADGTARTQGIVLGRERAVGGAQSVIVEAVASNDEHDGEREQPGQQHAHAVSAFGIFADEDVASYTCSHTHGCFSPRST